MLKSQRIGNCQVLNPDPRTPSYDFRMGGLIRNTLCSMKLYHIIWSIYNINKHVLLTKYNKLNPYLNPHLLVLRTFYELEGRAKFVSPVPPTPFEDTHSAFEPMTLETKSCLPVSPTPRRVYGCQRSGPRGSFVFLA